MRCLGSARFDLLADILKPGGAPATSGGEYVITQDPVSGAIVRTWHDNPATTGKVEGSSVTGLKCFVEDPISASSTGGSNGETWASEYVDYDLIKVTFSGNPNVTLRDRITNIRSGSDVVYPGEYNVDAVMPVFDPLSRKIVELTVIAKRAQVSG